jgi:23S rRNA (guanosine2251-2'-O)-methyltransferase
MQNLLTFGVHAVTALFSSQTENIECLYIQKDRQDKRLKAIIDKANHYGVPIITQSKQKLDDLCEQGKHQGVIVRCYQPIAAQTVEQLLHSITHDPFLLILDEVKDPHNLGACLRSADAAGVDAIIITKNNSVGLTPSVKKIASGAAETIPVIVVTNLANTIKTLQTAGIWIVGTSDKATKTLYETPLTGPLALVLGSEEKGLRQLTQKHCDHLAKIPMQGYVKSLNVSVAAGICLFESIRQRSMDKK